VTASRVSTERVRKVRFFQQHEYISLDYARRDALRVTTKKTGRSRNSRMRSYGVHSRAFAGRTAILCGRCAHRALSHASMSRRPRRLELPRA